jgi:putative ABC transport system ATP-binding protein
MLLEVNGLVKRYERGGAPLFAADHLSFSLGAGDFVSITGRSGSGKSTLLNLLAGMLRADEGDIAFDGDRYGALDDAALSGIRNRKIGYIPQGHSVLYDLTVGDNVRLPLYLRAGVEREAEIRGRVRALLGRVGIAALENEYPHRLSGGELRRVAIARSLVADPKILIADEPTGDLDPTNTAEVMALFQDIHRRGTAVLMATHETDNIRFGNRHFIMDAGKLREVKKEGGSTWEQS